MASRYQIVCMVVDRGSLKGAADELGYTQSAVSQAVKALERELGTTLIERGKQGVSLTRDGKQYLPYLRQIVTADPALEGKRQELLGLSSTDIRIATFTNVSRTVLPLAHLLCLRLYHPDARAAPRARRDHRFRLLARAGLLRRLFVLPGRRGPEPHRLLWRRPHPHRRHGSNRRASAPPRTWTGSHGRSARARLVDPTLHTAAA